ELIENIRPALGTYTRFRTRTFSFPGFGFSRGMRRTIAVKSGVARVIEAAFGVLLVASAAGTIWVAVKVFRAHQTATGFVLIGAAFVALLLAVAVYYRIARQLQMVSLERSSMWRIVEAEVEALVRQVTTELESAEDRWSNEFTATEAPALVELDANDAVPTRTRNEILGFIGNHQTSAIGIAGPRGAGKSTLMNQLRFDPKTPTLAVYVPAPVYYDPNEFTRLIHTELAVLASNRTAKRSV